MLQQSYTLIYNLKYSSIYYLYSSATRPAKSFEIRVTSCLIILYFFCSYRKQNKSRITAFLLHPSEPLGRYN
jgi:hypothetical protein